ncbi:MAG: zf-HC2 domain-containing protein [Candidatus Nanopelagicales bacterium]
MSNLPLTTSLFGNRQMTSCRKALKLLQQALDGELDEPTMARVMRHFDACVDCGMTYQTYAAIKAGLTQTQSPEVPADILQDLQEFARLLPEREGTAEPPQT